MLLQIYIQLLANFSPKMLQTMHVEQVVHSIQYRTFYYYLLSIKKSLPSPQTSQTFRKQS